jgi:hypothetical protein
LIAAALKGTGQFALTVKQLDGAGAPAVTGADIPKQGIKLDGTINSGDGPVSLGLGDKKRDFAGKSHVVKLTGGKKYQMDLVKEEGMLDPLLIVQDSQGQLLFLDDDGGGNLNSRLHFYSVITSNYTIWAAALQGEGKYALAIKEVPLSKDETVLHEVGPDGVKLKGSLTRTDRAFTYRFKLERTKRYVIDMIAANPKQLDPFLKVYGADGKLLAQDDDSGGDLNARLTFQAPVSGTFFVTAFPLAGGGDFTLEIRPEQ